MSLGSISFLVHTSNRPEFVCRMLDELARHPESPACRVILMDGSDDARAVQTGQMLAERKYAFAIDVIRSDRELPLQHRFALALPQVTTPYVALCADDDFYMPDAMSKAARHLDSHPEVTTAYGHTALFTLQAFEPYSALTDVWIASRRNPPLRWLEGDRLIDRFAEFEADPDEPSAIGWYALQRTSTLAKTTQIALAAGLGNYLLEYLQILVQVALGKCHMMDTIYLLRQHNPQQRHNVPDLATLASQFEMVTPLAADLIAAQGVDAGEAKAIAQRFFDRIALFGDRYHAPGLLQRSIRAFPKLAQLLRTVLRRAPEQRADAGMMYPDRRLPPVPALNPEGGLADLIAQACTPPANLNQSGGRAAIR